MLKPDQTILSLLIVHLMSKIIRCIPSSTIHKDNKFRPVTVNDKPVPIVFMYIQY